MNDIGSFRCRTAESQTTNAHGSYITISTIQIGSTSSRAVVRFTDAGNINVLGNNIGLGSDSTPNVGIARNANGILAITNGSGTTASGSVQALSFITVPVTLTDASTIAVDASLGSKFRCSSAVDRTVGAPTNGTDGQIIEIAWKNTDSSSHNLTLTTSAGGFRFGSDITGLSATAAGKIDYITAVYNSSDNKWDVRGYVKGF